MAVKALEYVANAQYFDSHQSLEENLRDTLVPGEVLVIMGAGDVTLIADSLIK
jgi:UDP-N-acetylmuramate-alanine ligase